MKKYCIIMSCALLTSCSHFNWWKSDEKPKVDHDTYVTSVSEGKQVYSLNVHADLSRDDLKGLKKLARSLVSNNTKKVVLTPVVSSADKVNMYKEALIEAKKVFTRAGIPNFEVYIRPSEVAEGQKSGIRIEAYTYTAQLPTAKKWKYPIGDIDTSKQLPNLGVSYEYNLGSMIANPKDLVDPAPLDNMDAAKAISATKKSTSSSSSSGTSSSGQSASPAK